MGALERHGLYDDVWQPPAVMVPCAPDYDDGSAEGETIIVRPVASQRPMTARPVELPWAMVEELRRDALAIEGVTGLALDLTSKPPGTIEWE